MTRTPTIRKLSAQPDGLRTIYSTDLDDALGHVRAAVVLGFGVSLTTRR